MKPFIKTVFCGISLVLIAGCSKNNDRPAVAANNDNYEPSTITPTPTPANSTRSATESIALSRCQREQACNNVGADKKFSSASDCLARIRNDWKDDLNARECPNGVNQVQLDECLSKIRSEECSSPFDTLSRVAECTASQICEG